MNYEDFKVVIPITRAYKNDDGDMMLEGIASSTTIDSYETIFNENCQEGFAMDINGSAGTEEPVVLEAEHLGEEEPMNILGPIEKAQVTSDNKLYIVSRLDEINPKAVWYYNVMTQPDTTKGRPKQFGLSINGVVREAHWEYNEELKKNVRVFDRVELRKVGIVRAPSNPDTWVQKIARSVNWDTIETKENLMAKDELAATTEATTEQEVERTEEVSETTQETTVENAEVVTEETTEIRQEDTQTENVEETTERTEDTTQDNSEVTESTEQTQEETTEQRSEEIVEQTNEETVNRTDYWQSRTILGVLSSVAEAMSNIEWYIQERQDWQGKDATAAKNALAIMNTSIPMLMGCFAEEIAPNCSDEQRAMDTDNTECIQKEDLQPHPEDCTCEDCKSKRSAESETTTDETIQRSEENLTRGVVEEIFKSMSEEFFNKMNEAMSSMVAEVKTEVERKVTEVETKNTELVERLAKVENAPATKPGIQLVQQANVERAKTESDRIKEAIERAKAKGDEQEVYKNVLYAKFNNINLD